VAHGGDAYFTGASGSVEAYMFNSTLENGTATAGQFGNGLNVGQPGQALGGDLWTDASSQLKLANTILAGGSVKGFTTLGPDCVGGVLTGGDNLLGDGDGCSGLFSGDPEGDQVGNSLARVNPLLGSLQKNGGPTETMAPQPGSPVIGRGNAAVCNASPVGDLDQRGYPRLSLTRSACDVGAFDTAEPEGLVLAVPRSATQGKAFSMTVSAVEPSGVIDTAYRGTVSFSSSDTAAALPGPYSFTSANAGRHVFTVTLHTAGTRTLTTADEQYPVIRGTSPEIKVAVDRMATLSALSTSQDPSTVNHKVTYTDTVSPAPHGGTITFTTDGKAIAGCRHKLVTTNRATCSVTYKGVGTRRIGAGYSGDGSYVPSHAPVLTEKIRSG
jgi:hypothetical protein